MAVLLLLGAVALRLQAADPYWTNTATITEPPQIDAVNFLNTGTISISTTQPFETSNTRNFTNSGTMIGAPGWFFLRSAPNIGKREMADNFVNQNGAIIRAVDPTVAGFVVGLGGVTPIDPSYLWVHASNIVNKGTLTVGANGWLKLAGTNISLARSGVQVSSIVPIGSSNGDTNFFPDAGIYDLWWGQTNIVQPPGMPIAGIWRATAGGGTATTPAHDVTYPGGFGRRLAFQVSNPIADTWATTNDGIVIAITNLIGLTNTSGTSITNVQLTNLVSTNLFIATNITRQAVFVSVSDPSVMSVNIQWFPSSSPTNFFMTPEVEISVPLTNVVTASQDLNTIFLYDTLASETNRGVLGNIMSPRNADTFRPNPYLVSRISQAGFGLAGNGFPDSTFLWDRNMMTNPLPPSDYAAYGAFIDNLPSEPALIPAGTVTNLPGRVQIFANSLDMTRTRVRGEGLVTINTKHLVSSSNAVVDSQNLSFNLTSTNNNLRLMNLASERVARMKGDLYIWSATWQQTGVFITDNWSISNTNFDDTGTNMVSIDVTNTPATNNAIIGMHALLVNGANLLGVLPVTVWDVESHSRDFAIDDRISVVQSFFIDAQNFTLNGRVTFSNASWLTAIGTTMFTSMPDFTQTNAPNLLNFTNNGIFRVPNYILLGSDRDNPLASIVNTGTIASASFSAASSFFQNNGSISTGPLSIKAGTAILQGGSISATDASIKAENLRVNTHQITANTLDLDVSGVLADVGFVSGSSNLFSVRDGINLLRKPAAGDLLGSTIRIILPDFLQVDNTWAGIDRGASPSGYQDNAAVGALIIGPVGRDPLAFFKGAQPGSALYVDLLDVSALGANVETWMQIDPSITIYYATVRLGFTPPAGENGIVPTPEEYLDGKFDGHLRWVRSYSGGQSSVAVLVNGQTVFMNIALRNSRTIDSDNDGIPNYFDTTPLGGNTPSYAGNVTLQPGLISKPGQSTSKTFSMSWIASPNAIYDVEVATDLASGNWQPLTSFTNSTPAAQPMTISDDKTPDLSQRFYRVRTRN